MSIHPKRWWGIRHVRCIWLSYKVHNFARQMGQMGLGFGRPNPSDLDHLDSIWNGEI